MIRYGVIGAGMMGAEHVRNLNALEGAVVSAIADPHPPSRESCAALAGADAQTFADHRAMLAADLCDAVVVASPNMTHADILADALRNPRLHILVEKPLCVSVAECRRTIALAKDRPGLVWVGLEYRYMPPAARLIREVENGAAGRVRMISIREHRFPFLQKVGNWNRFNRNTGGTLVEKCCHFFDLMNLLAKSRPLRVAASGGRDVNHLEESHNGETPDILDNAYVIVEYESGARAMLDLCMFAEATRNQEEISVAGDRGKVEALIPQDVVRVGVRGRHNIGEAEEFAVRDDSILHEGLHHGASYLEHRQFLSAIRAGGPAEVTLEDGLWSVAMGVAAHRAMEQKRMVEMDEVMGGKEGEGEEEGGGLAAGGNGL